MSKQSTYKLVRDKLSSEYKFHLEALKGLLSKSDDNTDVRAVEDNLMVLASLKMKIEILDNASQGTVPEQQLLFD